MKSKCQRMPFLSNDDVLIAPLHSELNDEEMQEFETILLAKCAKKRNVRGVVLDVSSLEAMDLFTARMLQRITSKLALMDLNSVLVGVAPEVAMTLVEMEMTFPDIKTAKHLEHGIRVLKQLQ